MKKKVDAQSEKEKLAEERDEISKEIQDIDTVQEKILKRIKDYYQDLYPYVTKNHKLNYVKDIGPIENTFIVTNYTIPQLAKIFRVTPDLLYQYSCQYAWMDKRKDYQECYKNELQSILKKNVVGNAIQINNRHLKLWNKILDYAEKELDKPENMEVKTGPCKGQLSMNKLQAMCYVIQQAQNGQRSAKGMASADKELDASLESEKIALERQKLGLNGTNDEDEDTTPDLTDVVKDSISDIWDKKDTQNVKSEGDNGTSDNTNKP